MSPELSAALIALAAAAVRLAGREVDAWRHRTGRERSRRYDDERPLERRRSTDPSEHTFGREP